MTLDHCEACGKVSNNLAVVDSVLTCPACVDRKNESFRIVLAEIRWEDCIKNFRKKKQGKKK